MPNTCSVMLIAATRCVTATHGIIPLNHVGPRHSHTNDLAPVNQTRQAVCVYAHACVCVLYLLVCACACEGGGVRGPLSPWGLDFLLQTESLPES